MAVFNKTNIDGDLVLQDSLNDKGEVTLKPSYKIRGTVRKNEDNNYILEQNLNEGTKLLKNVQDELSLVLGRTQKLTTNYWAATMRYDGNTESKAYFKMTYEQIEVKDANGKVTGAKDGDPNLSVWLMGDSLRIYGRMQYENGGDDKLDGNFVNKVILRLRIHNPDHMIKCVHKAAGQTAGWGNAAAIYAVNTPVGAKIAKADSKGNYKFGQHKIAIDTPVTQAQKETHWQVNKENVTGRMESCADSYNSIWIDIKLSAVTHPTKNLSFYITCPVELNSNYFGRML